MQFNFVFYASLKVYVVKTSYQCINLYIYIYICEGNNVNSWGVVTWYDFLPYFQNDSASTAQVSRMAKCLHSPTFHSILIQIFISFSVLTIRLS
jgi:hypothetical protein